ncbi:MAG: DUF4169 family protein [Reyranellaceae bacterium]
MAEIVNLRRARKDKQRREHDQQAAANRRLFGRTRAEKAADAATRQSERLDERALAGKKLGEESDDR